MKTDQNGLSIFQNHTFSAEMLDNFPYLVFNSSLIVCQSNERFRKSVSLSTFDLNDFRISNYKQNALFVSNLNKAEKEGMSVFSGSIFLYNAQFYQFENCVCIHHSSTSVEDAFTTCIFTAGIAVVKGVNLLVDINKKHNRQNLTIPAISIHADNGKFIYLSDTIEELLGYSYEELLSNSPYSVVHQEDIELVKSTLQKLESGEKSVTTRYRMVHKDGHIKDVETSSYRIDDIDKKSSFIVNVTIDITDTSDIMRLLSLSEERYHKLIMSLPIGIVLVDPNGFMLEVNDALRKMMRLPVSSVLPDFNFMSFEPMLKTGIAEKFKHCMESKQIVNGEIDYAVQDEGIRNLYLRYSFIPHMDSHGEVIGVIGNILDLSDLRDAELENKRQSEFLNLVINSSSNLFFVKDEEHKWVILNDAFVSILGHSREELIGKSDFDIFPTHQAEVFWQKDEEVFAKGKSVSEEDFTGSNNKIRRMLTYKNLYVDSSTNRRYVVGFAYDITELKKVENDLRQSMEKYQQLFENANDLIITVDLEGKITNANKKVISYLGLPRESILGMQIEQYVHKDDLSKLEKVKEEILQGAELEPIELRAYNSEDRYYAYEVKGSLISYNHVLVGIQVIFSDITTRYETKRKLEKYTLELEALNTTKDKFFSIIAHDLRSPYSSIIGFAELLLEDFDNLSKDEVLDYVRIIKNSAKNSLNLLENLLTWSRLEMDRLPFEPTRENLRSSADEVLSVLFSLAFRKKIVVENAIADALFVFADKNMLNTILHNLIMNAIKFTPMEGSICLSAKIELMNGKEWVLVSVTDSGIGMEPKLIDEVLTSPRPSSRLGTERETGTGLGLILSREMVERHGGEITIVSSQNKGSKFTFMLPVTE